MSWFYKTLSSLCQNLIIIIIMIISYLDYYDDIFLITMMTLTLYNHGYVIYYEELRFSCTLKIPTTLGTIHN